MIVDYFNTFNYVKKMLWWCFMCFEICFDEHYVKFSFHDLLERVCEEHDAIWTWKIMKTIEMKWFVCMITWTQSTNSVDALA